MADNTSENAKEQATKPTPSQKTYEGRCHCGAIKFSVASPALEEGYSVTSCNCSICVKQGLLLIYPNKTDMKWHSGEDEMKGYRFATKNVEHLFCPTCGTNIGARSVNPDFFFDKYALNIRTFRDVDLIMDNLALNKADGKSREPTYVP